MHPNNDFERLFSQYKGEGLSDNESIEYFYDRHGVPHNLFDKWYHDTRHKIVAVKISGRPDANENSNS